MSSIIKFPSPNKTTFILCDCKSEVLVIDYDQEYELADISIYENFASYSSRMSFWQKVRYIYRILIHHTPYTDQIILNKGQLKQLKNFLDNL